MSTFGISYQVPHGTQVPHDVCSTPASPMTALFAPIPTGGMSDPTACATPGEARPSARARRARFAHPFTIIDNNKRLYQGVIITYYVYVASYYNPLVIPCSGSELALGGGGVSGVGADGSWVVGL